SADRGAKLALDRGEVSVDAVEPLFGLLLGEPARFSVAVRDQSGDWPLQGLHARLEEAKGPGNAFDPPRDMHVLVNGKAVEDFWSLDARSTKEPSRNVPAAGQAVVAATLPDLPPGQYSAKIRFLAANSQADPGQ